MQVINITIEEMNRQLAEAFKKGMEKTIHFIKDFDETDMFREMENQVNKNNINTILKD